jgi:hypothetical protein
VVAVVGGDVVAVNDSTITTVINNDKNLFFILAPHKQKSD